MASASTSRVPAPRRGIDTKGALLAAFALATALASGWHAFALANQPRFPVVLMIAPGDPGALARSAGLEAALREQDGGRPAKVAQLARSSLVGSPLNPFAIRLLALAKGAKLSESIDEELATLVSDVSKRDVGGQALRIRLAAPKGDLKAVLAAYDVILRNGDGNEEQFFAPMATAINTPAMVPHFAPYVRGKAPWVPAFLAYAIPKAPEPEQIVSAVAAGGGLDAYAEGPALEVMLINRLLQLGRWRQAAAFYRTTRAFVPAALASPAINRDNLVPRENGLLWFLYQKEGPIAESVADKAIVVYADAGQAGEVGHKLLFLRPGHYRLTFEYEQLDLPDGAKLVWTGRCLDGTDVRQLWTTTAGAAEGIRRQSAAFGIDPACTVFDLALGIDAGEARRGVSATITRISLTKTPSAGE